MEHPMAGGLLGQGLGQALHQDVAANGPPFRASRRGGQLEGMLQLLLVD